MKNKLQKKIKSKQIFFVILILLIVIFLDMVISNFLEKKYRENIKNTEYSTFEDFKTAKEYIIYSGNTYIKEEKSKQENFYKDIYMTFKKDLYTKEKSNQYFYERTIKIIANTLNYENFRIIDDEKQLLITVICEDKSVKRIYYNGDENYFEKKDSIESIKNFEDTKITEFNIQSKVINNLIKNDWYFAKVQFGTRTNIQNQYEIYEKEGIRIKNIERKVFNVVFLKDYKEKIVNNLTTESTTEEIVNSLGEPTFKEYGIIGYKGKDIYIFFGEDFVSIYRIENDTKGYEEFVEIQKNFREDKDVKKLISKMTELWEDFDTYKVESNSVNIRYSLRGIEIKINIDKENGFVFYNNYIGKIDQNLNLAGLKNSNQELPKYTYVNATKDLVQEYENQRAMLFGDMNL